MRKELGYVDVQDESKLYLIGTDTRENMNWRWHLHVPKGKFRLVWTTGLIEEFKVPDRLEQNPATSYPASCRV